MLKLFAPAKLNLHLHVTGKREDGYHYLDSLVAFTDEGDFLTFESSHKYELNIIGPFSTKLNGENLISKAAQLIAGHLGRAPNIRITLEKNLPLGAGIGGGSTDAATTLKGLNQFWDADISLDALRSIAVKIGADVVTCLEDKPVIMRGIGDITEPAPTLPEIHAVLVWPDCFASTPDVYKNLALPSYSRNFHFKEAYNDTESLLSDLMRTGNDLQQTSSDLFPPIRLALDALNRSGSLFTRMSGSGSTVFGIFKNAATAQEEAALISKERPDWWVRPVKVN